MENNLLILIATSESGDVYYYAVDEKLTKDEWDGFVKRNISWETDEEGFNFVSDVSYVRIKNLQLIKENGKIIDPWIGIM